MKFLAVHPSPLMYTKIYLRLEPLGLELVAQAVRQEGHEVRILDLQVEDHKAYLACPQQLETRCRGVFLQLSGERAGDRGSRQVDQSTRSNTFVFVGGHSASFVAREFLEHAEGAIDCVLKGEGEVSAPLLMTAVEHDRKAITKVPGVMTLDGEGPASPIRREPRQSAARARSAPAPAQVFHRRAGSLRLDRVCTGACPWDCSFCSAWTFYGRSYRMVSPEKAVDEAGAGAGAGDFPGRRRRLHPGENRGLRSVRPLPDGASRNSITWKPEAMSCSATRRCSNSGRR